jgi:CheY-like chemotaxis protein
MNRSALILLVEDDQSMLSGMADLFQMPGLLEMVGIDYEVKVLTANNGQEALAIMADNTPDLIVSDIMMPVMDGYAFLAKVQENPQWLHIPFIFLTAKGEKEEILKGQVQGANLYITKPFASTDLMELIASQLERSFQRQLRNQQNIGDLKKGILQILNHEFRTPLTYVTAYYEMLSESLNRFPENRDFQEYLRGIQTGCIRLTRLIEDFITVIELRTGEYKTKYHRRAKIITTINQIVKQAVDAYAKEAKSKGIDFEISLAPDLLPIYGDGQSLLAVLDRVLNNAVKFTAVNSNGHSRIFVSTNCQDDYITISIRDQGIGFPEKYKASIFDLFFQYNRVTMEQQGAGTGLTIAKGLVELHNGRIEVASEERIGSTFAIKLPVFSDSFDQTKDIPEDTGRIAATILAVEDEENLLMGLKELLEIASEKYDLTVLTAVNGQAGLEMLKKHKPDLIISDIMMPVMDGYEFLEKVRQVPDWIHIPFIFLTAKGERQDVHRGLKKGAEVYITKPYDSDDLLKLVTSQLDQYFQLQGVQSQNFDSLKRSILQLITPDFRLPLTAVKEYSDTLFSDLDNIHCDVELKKSLRGIHEGSIRLTNLVEDFISLAEIKTGEAETAYALREQPIFNPGLIFCDIGKSNPYINSLRHINLRCESLEGLSPIYGDAESLMEGMRRLLEAVAGLYANDEQRELLVAGSQNDTEVVCSLVFPPAIPADVLKQFVKILQEDDPDLLDSTNYAPSLIIAKSYIALNNGRIQFTSYPNQITISFPVYTEPVSA